MVFRKILAGMVAGAMAVGALAITTSAAGDIVGDTSQLTTQGVFSEGDDGWRHIDLGKIVDRWENPFALSDYEKIEVNYSVADVGNATHFCVFMYGQTENTAGWQDQSVDLKVGENQKLVFDLAKFSGKTTEQVGLRLISTTAGATDEFTGKVTINSAKIVAKTGGNDPDAPITGTHEFIENPYYLEHADETFYTFSASDLKETDTISVTVTTDADSSDWYLGAMACPKGAEPDYGTIATEWKALSFTNTVSDIMAAQNINDISNLDKINLLIWHVQIGDTISYKITVTHATTPT
ncbi:MAG: hypothetical protein J1F60_08275, partial [Oscillospiraceae bacterium]|nr:hypothetical protein [Oscillospiraceae bacterium]